MDSGNSDSLQSSSGDEEYDSRPDQSSLPADFLNHSNHYALPLSLNPQSFLPHHPQEHHPTLFDPSPNLFHAFSQSLPNPSLTASSLLNHDVVRPRGLRSDQDCTDLTGNFPGSSSSSSPLAQSASQLSILGSGQGNPLPSMQLRSAQANSSPSDPTHVVARNPKKRTRASRRAPTTVLTTDTSNFRAMVQEFTGIPAPPFSGSPYTRRLDLFGSGMRSSHLEQMGSLYPLRPSAQKFQNQQSPLPFSSSTSLLNDNTTVDSANIVSTSTTNNNNSITTSSFLAATSSTFSSSSINTYQLPSDLGQLSKQPQNLLNIQNQMLSFQSFSQPPFPLHHSSLNLPTLASKSPLPSLHELGMSHGQVNANWREIQSHNVTTTSEGIQLRNDHTTSCKLNSSAPSSSDFLHHDKGLENVPPRGEGGIDQWICPSE